MAASRALPLTAVTFAFTIHWKRVQHSNHHIASWYFFNLTIGFTDWALDGFARLLLKTGLAEENSTMKLE